MQALTPDLSSQTEASAPAFRQAFTKRLLLCFIAVEICVCLYVFGSAIWGARLLAPLDIAPALFSKFSELDPQSSHIPANHHIIDQLTYDLPLQWTIYHAYNRGEIPWWDPFTYAGRPLLADAHINGTDPIRCLSYFLLPFELAYNWTLITHFLLSGFAMFLLLRRLEFPQFVSFPLAVAYQFSSAFALQIGHPWLQAVFAYYPLVWLSWHRWVFNHDARWISVAGIFLGCVFLSGNLQSHSYVALLTLPILVGYCGSNWHSWKRVVPGIILSGVIGFCIGAPVVLNQLEFFIVGARPVDTSFNRLGIFGGLASLSTVYPWILGTFRTLDLSKLADQILHYGFAIFVGSAAACLAFVGGFRRAGSPALEAARRTSLALLGLYFLIASTPLVKFLYLRCSALAAMALIVLAATGVITLRQRIQDYRRAGWLVFGLALVCAISTNVFAFFIYPKFVPDVKEAVLHRKSYLGDSAVPLRSFQVEHLPDEISFRNPETILATSSLLGLALLLLRPSLRTKESAWALLLTLNALPVLGFASRFIPKQPIDAWHRLLEGGSEQQKLMALLRNKPLRLFEDALFVDDQAFPNAMSHLYNVRTVHGYSSLYPRSIALISVGEKERLMPQFADIAYHTDKDAPQGRVITNRLVGLSRFQWVSGATREFSVAEPGLNTISIVFKPGAAGKLLWTDTAYPGWNAKIDGKSVPIRKHEPCSSEIEIPPQANQLVLHYRPRFLSLGLALASLGLAGVGVCFFSRRLGPKPNPSAPKQDTAHPGVTD